MAGATGNAADQVHASHVNESGSLFGGFFLGAVQQTMLQRVGENQDDSVAINTQNSICKCDDSIDVWSLRELSDGRDT